MTELSPTALVTMAATAAFSTLPPIVPTTGMPLTAVSSDLPTMVVAPALSAASEICDAADLSFRSYSLLIFASMAVCRGTSSVASGKLTGTAPIVAAIAAEAATTAFASLRFKSCTTPRTLRSEASAASPSTTSRVRSTRRSRPRTGSMPKGVSNSCASTQMMSRVRRERSFCLYSAKASCSMTMLEKSRSSVPSECVNTAISGTSGHSLTALRSPSRSSSRIACCIPSRQYQMACTGSLRSARSFEEDFGASISTRGLSSSV